MSELTRENVDKICELLIGGKSLAQICVENPDLPKPQMVFYGLHKNPQFLEDYARAREAQTEAYALELTELADNASLSAESINKARLQIDTRKWIMSRLKPKKYGDNQQVNHSGTIQHEQLVIQRTPKTIDHESTIKALPIIDIDNVEK